MNTVEICVYILSIDWSRQQKDRERNNALISMLDKKKRKKNHLDLEQFDNGFFRSYS